MPKIAYITKNFREDTLTIIAQANLIIDEYTARGFDLTLRQLYYQFIARDLFPSSWEDPGTHSTNNQRSYKRLGDMINNARLAGLIDWLAITDRTRNLRQLSAWESPNQILRAIAQQYRIDKWKDQDNQIECWIEKDALLGTIEGVCNRLQIPYFSCRGYVSQSEMWVAAERLKAHHKTATILHLGDHDPSGIDMSRDIEDRLRMFGVRDLTVDRIALTEAQITQYNPPPNPAKESDARWQNYVDSTGFTDSWELDALDPTVLADLIEDAVLSLRDDDLWDDAVERERGERAQIATIRL